MRPVAAVLIAIAVGATVTFKDRAGSPSSPVMEWSKQASLNSGARA
jgi:hypothetical protein